MSSAHPIVVTGAAGFIGHATSLRLLAMGHRVVGIDNLNAYYDPALKQARLAQLQADDGFEFHHFDISDADAMARIVKTSGARKVVHLAAQAGVRHSIDNPFAYEQANLKGHLAVLEACRHAPGFEHLVYASSSSVYGDRPMGGEGFQEDEPAVSQVSLYGATKRCGELMSHSYAKLYGFPMTGLRFFTVYGPWGRPDMAYFSFTRKILAGRAIEVYGQGRMARDFTYIDDIVDGMVGALDRPPEPGTNRILNIGDSRPVGLIDMIRALESALGVEAEKVMMPKQAGDVTATYADVSRLAALTGYRPKVMLEDGLQRFADWYFDFYGRPTAAAVTPGAAHRPPAA